MCDVKATRLQTQSTSHGHLEPQGCQAIDDSEMLPCSFLAGRRFIRSSMQHYPLQPHLAHFAAACQDVCHADPAEAGRSTS